MVDTVALAWHLQANLFPPIKPTATAIAACVAAIQAVAEGEAERVVVAGDDLLDERTAGEVVRDLHLDDFVDQLGADA